MSKIKNIAARRAVKATAKHTAHGTASRLRRDPIRATSLLVAGAVFGAVAGWAAGRSASPSTTA